MGRRSQRFAAAALFLYTLAASACSTNAVPAAGVERPAVPQMEQPDRMHGEYIITVKPDAKNGAQRVREAYSEFGVVGLTSIGERRYLLRIERDPGPEAIQQKAGQVPSIESTQPNFRYRLQ